MQLPLFYKADIALDVKEIILDETTSRHVVQVLRMQVGSQLKITDGKGNLFLTELTDDHKKKAVVKLLSSSCINAPQKKVSIAISLVKNASRFEWFLEKATEIGVSEIIPLVCHRTEKQHFRAERMNGIVISAMLQSQQCWLPVLHAPATFEKFISMAFDGNKFIAHCEDENNKEPLTNKLITQSTNKLILIGPEGDFTKEEIKLALKNNFHPVALGDTRLRTETAGMVAATLLCML